MQLNSYYFDRLSAEDKAVYEEICQGLKQFKSKLTVPYTPNLSEICKSVNFEHPEFFFVDWTTGARCVNSGYRPPDENARYLSTHIEFTFLYNRLQTEVAKKKLNVFPERFLKNDSYDTVLAVHDYFAENTIYDYDALRQERFTPDNHNLIGAIIKRKAVCEGIGKAMLFVLRALNIPCCLAEGTAGDAADGGCAHIWNVVSLGGRNYHIDATLDGYAGRPEFPLPRRDYFCLSDREIAKDHSFRDVFDCIDIENRHNYFKRNRLFFRSIYEVKRYIASLSSETSFFGIRLEGVQLDAAAGVVTAALTAARGQVRVFPNQAQSVIYFLMPIGAADA